MNAIIVELSLEYKTHLNKIFLEKSRLKISSFLTPEFLQTLSKQIITEKTWKLGTGIDANKYEKDVTPQNEKANALQIKNVTNAFGQDRFSYIFYRGFSGKNMSISEFTIRKVMGSPEFIEFLNSITGLGLTQLTTLFLSKYKSGNFLSPHSDKGNGRLAFVLNLSMGWKPQYGGNLHFMNDERTEIIETVCPEYNSFFIFHVPPEKGIPHFVGHVAPNVRLTRYAITGWFS
jgi:Rps23 Pro-64 3,4-dihydroxylase Tpa1-like proline 4-hydroxylase